MRPSSRPLILRNAQTGFTFIWVLLLVAFVGLGLAAATEAYSTVAQRDKEKELLFIGRQFRSAIMHFYQSHGADGKNEYPQTLEELLKDSRTAETRRYLRKIYRDPITGKSDWGLVRVAGRIVGIHSLSDRRPIKQDGFEGDEIGFKGKEKYSQWIFTYPSNLHAN